MATTKATILSRLGSLLSFGPSNGLVLPAQAVHTDEAVRFDQFQTAIDGPGRRIIGATFAASVSDGDIVRYDSMNSQYVAAVADGTSNDAAVGVADATNGVVYIYGNASLFSGLTVGDPYYLSPIASGSVTNVRPDRDAVSVGVATSPTTIMVAIAHLGVTSNYLKTQGFELVSGSGPKPGKSAIIGGVAMRQSYIIPAALSGSEARALTAFTGSASFSLNVYPAGSTIATLISRILFAAGSTTGTFSSSSVYNGSAGDMLTVEAPTIQDSTGAGVGITIHGTYV